MKNTLPVENEAIKVGCKQQREDWVWLPSWGNPPTSLTPESSAENTCSDEDSWWQLATGGCNTVAQCSGKTARRPRAVWPALNMGRTCISQHAFRFYHLKIVRPSKKPHWARQRRFKAVCTCRDVLLVTSNWTQHVKWWVAPFEIIEMTVN